MFVNLLGLSIFLEQTTKDTHTSDPDDLLRHASVGRALALACSCVTTLTTCQRVLAYTRPRVNGDRLANDQTILYQLANVLPYNAQTKQQKQQ